MPPEDTPPAQRSITVERTEVRTRIPTAASVLLALVCGTFCAAMAYSDLKHEVRDARASIDEVRAWARSFDRDYDRRVLHADPISSAAVVEPRTTP